MFRKVLIWSLIGHLAALLILWAAGCINLRPKPSTEIIQLQNVQMLEREVPEPPPTPEPEPTPRPTPPPPPPPEERPTPQPEPVPEVPVRRELPEPPERVIVREPDTATLELQRRQNEERRERQRQREEEERRREEEAERLRELQEQAREAAQQQPEPPPEPDRPVQVEAIALGNYSSLLVSYISRHWHSQREWAGQELSVRISMDIQRNGDFTGIVITTSSGNMSYDAAALEAVQTSSPGPPLPAFITEAPQHVTLRLMPR